MDGVGEWTTTSLALGNGRDLKVMREIHFPHSLGLLYSAFTYYTGFKVNSGEYKVMGLAPYGEPKYVSQIKDHLIDIKDDGSFRLNLEYFEYCTGLTMTNGNFDRLFGGPARKPEQKLTQREMDLAASIQAITEEVMLKLALGVAKDTGEKNLCLAGGVALNCVANGKLLRKKYSTGCGCSPRPATPAARWAPRMSRTFSIPRRAAPSASVSTPCAAAISGRSSRRPISRSGCAARARCSRCTAISS